MAKSVIKKGDLATCNHPIVIQVPKSNLFLNGKRVARVSIDKAGGGVIIGSHTKNIFINGVRVSLQNDLIESHDKSPHKSAKTKTKLTSVTVK